MSAPITGMSCVNCLYFQQTDEGCGECRRYAPQPNSSFFVTKMESVGKIKTDIHWPKVFNSNWCGQFAVRKKAQQKQVAPPKKILVRKPDKPAEGEQVLKLTPEEPEPVKIKQPPVEIIE